MGALVLAENYLNSIGSASRSVSSEDSDFPASNLYDDLPRSLTWRSAGYFEVTSANKVIRFEETASTPLTATIAESNYTSDSAFFTAVKAALDSAGASTYTVSRDSTTKKIKITSDGGGGGGVLNLLWTDGATTAADLLGFDDAADDTGALTYTADNIRIHTSEYIEWDLGASSNPDVFVAIGKRSTGVNVSPTATLTLEGNTTNTWTSPQYSQSITFDENALVTLKTATDDGLHTSALRYWRLTIVDKANANGFVEIAGLYLGEYYSPSTGRAQFPFSADTIDYSKLSRTDKGSVYATRNERVEAFGINWRFLTTTEKEIFDAIYKDVGQSKPFFVIPDSETAFSSDVNYLTKYCRFDGAPSSTLERPNSWSASWRVAEEV